MNTKATILTLLCISLILGLASASLADPHALGGLKDEVMPPWIIPSPPIEAQDGTDDFVDLSPNFPPVSSQGSLGSCTSFAAAYYYKSYQEWQEHGWDLTDPDHQFAPNFVYNQINGGDDNGSHGSDAMKVLCDQGCVPLSMMPYSQGDCVSFPTEEQFYAALPYRSQDAYVINLYAGIDDLKNHLLNGNAAIYSFAVYDHFNFISSYNNNYCLADVYGSIAGGHTTTICGFDDNRVTADGVGAFKSANSWGSNWGDGGYYWISYEAIQSSVICYGSAYYCTDRTAYTPTHLAVINVEHGDRFAMEYQLGIGDPDSPVWYHNFYNFVQPNITTPRAYPGTNMILDLSDGASYLTTGGSSDLYVECDDERSWNGITGFLHEFSMADLTWPAAGTASGLPQFIPDTSVPIDAELVLTQGPSTEVSGTVSGEWTPAGSPYAVTGDINVPAGATLYIHPGTQVLFIDDYVLEVGDGAVLDAAGTSADPIVFSPLLSVNGWGGIAFSGASDDSRLEYCEFRYGKSTASGNGGAVYCYDCSPTITHCTFQRNQATYGGAIYGELADPEITYNTFQNNEAEEGGGAIYLHTSTGTVSQNSFEENSADDGGAVYCYGASPTVATNAFTENDANGMGGAIACETSAAHLAENMFMFNSGTNGGAISSYNATPFIDGNDFLSNEGSSGGAIYCEQGTVTIADNMLYDNHATTGGGIRIYQSDVLVEGNEIEMNVAGSGGALNVWMSEVELNDNLITGNTTTGQGGAAYMLGSTAELLNNVIGTNEAAMGAGFYLINSNASFTNCTVAHNQAASSGGAVFCTNESNAAYLNSIVYYNEPDQFHSNEDSSVEACYSNVEGNWSGEGNIYARPYFMADDDYHLADWSPSIGSGASTMQIGEWTLSAPLVDLEGNLRPNPTGSDPDQGAYEHELGIPTGIIEHVVAGTPQVFELQQNVPNPFNPSTTITYALPKAEKVTLKVYNAMGSLVSTLVDGYRQPGVHQLTFDGSSLASGVYLVRIAAGDFISTRKMVLVK